MRRFRAGWLLLTACAPIDGPTPLASPEAVFMRDCDGGACACGGEGMRCCDAPPRCEGALRCREGSCQRVAPRCVARGIFQPGFLTADFIEFAGSTTRPCSEIPRELFDPRTPGTFPVPTSGVGALECEGLAPGERTVRLRARIRSLPQRHSVDACGCTGLTSAVLSVTQQSGATWTVTTLLRYPEGQVDEQCNRGPNVEWSQRVNVGSDGHLALVVDLTACANDGEPRCLFLRGAALTLDEAMP